MYLTTCKQMLTVQQNVAHSPVFRFVHLPSHALITSTNGNWWATCTQPLNATLLSTDLPQLEEPARLFSTVSGLLLTWCVSSCSPHAAQALKVPSSYLQTRTDCSAAHVERGQYPTSTESFKHSAHVVAIPVHPVRGTCIDHQHCSSHLQT